MWKYTFEGATPTQSNNSTDLESENYLIADFKNLSRYLQSIHLNRQATLRKNFILFLDMVNC